MFNFSRILRNLGISATVAVAVAMTVYYKGAWAAVRGYTATAALIKSALVAGGVWAGIAFVVLGIVSYFVISRKMKEGKSKFVAW